MKAVEVKGLSKSYGNIIAVSGLDLTVETGEIFGLLGPNGCGKTTTIKMLLGLVGPDSGAAEVLGIPVGRKGSLEGVGYMPQETALYEELTVRENLRLFAGVHGLSGKEYEVKEKEVLDLVDLGNRKGSILSTLSGGQRHRISLAVSLLHSPRLLFLDEPTVGVDPPLRARFWRTFREKARSGMAIVMTTHYMDEANNCDRVAMMRDGRVIAQGTPASIIERTHSHTLEGSFLSLSGTEVVG